MKAKEFLQLFVPPIYYKVRKHLCQPKETKHNPLPQVEHKSNRMIVIGNGPSLKDTIKLYHHQLTSTDCMMVNFSANTPLFEQIKPTYYTMIDPGWISEDGVIEEGVRNCIDAIVKKTTWPMTIVLPAFFKKWWAIDAFRKNPYLTLLFDNSDWRKMPDEELFKALDINRISPPSYTVLTYCIYLSIYWNYPETYLVGADTSFTRDMYVGQKDNVLYTIDTHYYNNQEVCPEPTDPEFKGHPFGATMEQKLYELYNVFYEYRMLNEYAKWKGVKLYNASEFSMIDCLERKKLV